MMGKMKKHKFTIMRILFTILVLLAAIAALIYIACYDYDGTDTIEKHEFIITVIGSALALITFILNSINSIQQKLQSMILQFEDNFFRLIDLQRKIREEIDHSSERKIVDGSSEHKTIVGRKVFYYLFNEWEHEVPGYNEKGFKPLISGENCVKIAELYNKAGAHKLLEHYFRHLYTIVRYVDDKDFLSDEQKREYVNMLRAQLSEFEIVYLYLNTIAMHNRYGSICKNMDKKCKERCDDTCTDELREKCGAEVLNECCTKKCFDYERNEPGCERFKSCKRFKIYIEKYALLDGLPYLPDYIKPEQRTFFDNSAYENK